VSELVAANDNDPEPPRPDWVSAAISSRPNGQLATYHERHPTFASLSPKTRRMTSEESYWERQYRVWWNLDPDVGDFEMQGLEIRMLSEGRSTETVYTLDAILARGGRLEAREIKASGSHLMEQNTARLMVNVADILARADIDFKPVTASPFLENRRLRYNLSYGSIHKNDVVPQAEADAVVNALAQGASRFSDIAPLLGHCPLLGKAKAFSLLASRRLWFDLQTELRDTSTVRAPMPTTAPNIRKINRRFVR
jgi:hypothetical protein